MSAESAVRAELNRLTQRFEIADAALQAARSEEDVELALERVKGVNREYWSIRVGLADLLLLLLHSALRHRPEQLHAMLAEALGPELAQLGEAILRIRGRS